MPYYKEYQKEYRKNHDRHIGKRGIKQPEWYRSRISHWKKYGIKLLPQFRTYWEQYAFFYIKAGKQCQICGKTLRLWYSAGVSPDKYKHMETASLDHNHKDGFPRGILCTNCNYVVGIVERRLNGNSKNISEYINNQFNAGGY